MIFYCLTHDQEDSYTAMRMPSTTDSRILEMAIVVGQSSLLMAAFKAIDFSGHLLIFQEIFGAFCCLSAHAVSCGEMGFAAMRLHQ